MRLAIPFKNHYKLNDVADEFYIYYDPATNDFNNLIDFIQTFQEKTISIRYRNGLDKKTALAIGRMFKNVKFVVSWTDAAELDALREADIRFYFSSSEPARSMSDLIAYDRIGVSDVYLADDCLYNMEGVKEWCFDVGGIQTRLVLNQVPITVPSNSPTIPLLRPQDFDVLDRYVDVAEFYCGYDKEYDFNKLSVLYRVWFEDKDWGGDLREINDRVPFPYMCRMCLPQSTSRKLNCGLACVRDDRHCTFCDRNFDLQAEMTELNVQFKPKMVRSE